MQSDTTHPDMPPRLPMAEFVALIAMLFSTIAFSIDAMLPGLPSIAQELTPGDINRAQLVVTSFVFGMGVGTFFTGPLSDAFGRRPVLLGGVAVYIFGAFLAWYSQSAEGLFAGRALQGLGAAGPRVVAMAMVRDLYSGRQMAKLMSFAMIVFSLVPAIAPALGALIIALSSWRGIFMAFMIFSITSAIWVYLRQGETLPRDQRIPLQAGRFVYALREAFSNRMFVLSTLVQTLIFGLLMALISSTHQIYDIQFHREAEFPFWFGASAAISASASLINAKLVVRLGMRALIAGALLVQLCVSLVMIIMTAADLWPTWLAFPAWFFWSTSLFFMLGFTMGNLNALAMEPMGHIAGMAASIIGAVSTVIGVAIAAPIGLAFNGSFLPLAVGAVVCTGLGWLIMGQIKKLERVSQ
ncbi:multidrug effflux MFS transporter [Halocynthiibacter sp.]|uniref:multidrug effflux MFS transporter n=1 Tax=Halocynthiibacter sp. TaxID=1979210 RepID=UPI003C61A772